MKNYLINTAIAISTIISTMAAQSIFASDWIENVESQKVQLANVLPSAFDCYSYDNGYSNSRMLLDSISRLSSKTAFERKNLTSWGWEKDLQRCKLVEEIQKFLENNDNKIDVNLTLTTLTRKTEYGKSEYDKICEIDVREEMKISFPNGLIYKDFNVPYTRVTCAEYADMMDESPGKNNLEIFCTTPTNFVAKQSGGYANHYFGSNTFTLRPGEFFELAYASLGSYSYFYVPQVRIEVKKTEPISVVYGVNKADWTAPEKWVLKTLDNPNGFEFQYRSDYSVFCKLKLEEIFTNEENHHVFQQDKTVIRGI